VRHPFHFKNARVEVVVPTLSALLTEPSFHKFSDKGPSLRAIFFNKFANKIIFLIGPWFLAKKLRLVVVRLWQ
jgi:hypothetical protein